MDQCLNILVLLKLDRGDTHPHDYMFKEEGTVLFRKTIHIQQQACIQTPAVITRHTHRHRKLNIRTQYTQQNYQIQPHCNK